MPIGATLTELGLASPTRRAHAGQASPTGVAPDRIHAPLQAGRLKPILALCGAAVAVAVVRGLRSPRRTPNTENGRALFVEKCGTCHALGEAATTAEIGPDLDAAFADARASGMDDDTIEGVVQSQIANPREADPEDTNIYMPADLVEGQDAEDVAAYVAEVAGVPGHRAAGGAGRPRRPGLRQQRLRLVPHLRRGRERAARSARTSTR